jgi:GT2 family glycosyltransferase
MRLFFSVIIPTHDRPGTLGQCLESLARLNYPREAFEVIVVDDGSSRPMRPVLDPFAGQMRVRLVRQGNAGPATARNFGARIARADWLVFIDDDCAPDPDWLGAFDAASPSEDEVLGGSTLNGLHKNRYSTASQQLLDYLDEYFFQGSSAFRFFTSNNMAVAARHFEALGGFDTRFPLAAGEDREFCYRWLQSGGRLRHVPQAIVTHAHFLTISSFLRQHFGYGRGGFTYDWLCVQRDCDRLRLRPLSFYTNLLGFPWRTENAWTACVSTALLFLSQAANAAGFLYQASHHSPLPKHSLPESGNSS